MFNEQFCWILNFQGGNDFSPQSKPVQKLDGINQHECVKLALLKYSSKPASFQSLGFLKLSYNILNQGNYTFLHKRLVVNTIPISVASAENFRFTKLRWQRLSLPVLSCVPEQKAHQNPAVRAGRAQDSVLTHPQNPHFTVQKFKNSEMRGGK